MRGPAHSQIELDSSNRPGICCIVPPCEKVNRQSADDAFVRERPPDPKPQILNGDAILIVGWKETSEVNLICRSAEDLLVRGSEEHLATRIDAQLHAWRSQLRGLDQFFDDTTAALEFLQESFGRF